MGVREKLAESKARLKQKEQEQTAGPEKSGEQATAELATDILSDLLLKPKPPAPGRGGLQTGLPAVIGAVPCDPRLHQARKSPPPVVCSTVIKVRCGHTVPFELYEERLDKHRETRRKKLTERDCPECRKTAQAAKEKADQEARQERLKNDPPKDQGWRKLARLPDLSHFNATYHSGEETWKGTLEIDLMPPGCDTPQHLKFYDEAPGVFKMLSKLDAKWRSWLRDHQPQEPPENKEETEEQ